MKLDRVGLDYLVTVAKDIGFDLLACETRETTEGSPTVTLRLLQYRTPADEYTPPARPAALDVERDIIPARKPTDREKQLTTLDEE